MVSRVVIGIVVAATVAAGCIHSELVDCADGRACPAGLVCDDVRGGCLSPDQLTACHGMADLATCQTGLIPDGVCFGGVCLPAGCGNAEIDPGELCDDGNLVSGDGCSADCRSREVCGDGYVDSTLGEACDDGDTSGHDGCTATCASEDVTWTPQTQMLPTARFLSAGVYDPFRKVFVVFSGGDGAFLKDLGDTWEWNGAQWRDVSPVFSPAARTRHALAYDPKRHRVVLFGGTSRVFGDLDDTWEYDGAAWQRLRPTVSPPASVGVTMAWDPAIGRIVMYGASSALWTWDGVQWRPIVTPQTPPIVRGAGMVYDAARDRLLLFGSTTSLSGGPTALWAFDGTTWSEVVTTGGPTVTEFIVGLAYDPIDGVPIAITDHFNSGVIVLDVWELSGTTWRPLLGGDYFRVGVILQAPVFVFDIARGVLVEWSGMTPTGPENGLFEYQYDIGWRDATIAPSPDLTYGSALAYDPERARVVACCNAGGTMEWDGVQWTAPIASAPGVGTLYATAYDGVSRRVLVFGGGILSPSNKTWAWDGAAWSDVSPTPSPSPRSASAMAYDSIRHRVVLFGGLDGSSVAQADTWEWDGAAWHDVTPASSPPALGAFVAGGSFSGPEIRNGPVMAFDRGRGRTVLSGGAPRQTWEWDGVSWTQRTSATIPGPFSSPAMVYDRARERVVLFGGSTTNFSQWEWDGTTWSQASIVSIAPDAQVEIGAAYDEVRAEIVKFGGSGYNGLDGLTWLGSYLGPDEELCGSGIDFDHDGAIGCADQDCAIACERCGDGTCNGGENDRLCPADCPAPPPICGDAYCAPMESVATCAADCL